jgi:lipopolysaccharide/colanic/teichoic acid biosynthesis glycosyltransferase
VNWKVKIVKRLVDVLSSAIGLAITAPLFALIAVAIKLDSKGPVFYRQRRAGVLIGREREDGVPRLLWTEFYMPKFRSMCTDAEKGTGAVLATEKDSRVTRVGRILRRTRLDELPQLWCVLTGQMSLVGPRPERPELLHDLAMAIPYFEERMRDVKPGITGLAQINLTYNGRAPAGSEIARLQGDILNPFKIAQADEALADGMRLKLLYDLAYSATLDDLGTYVRTEAAIIFGTPVTMLRAKGY